MSWALGFDSNWNRDVGYGVPAYCDHPGCMAEIHRGLAYVCGSHPYGGDRGCGLFFCERHLYAGGREAVHLCKRCLNRKPPRVRISPEHPEWIAHKLTDESWESWRKEHPDTPFPPRPPERRGRFTGIYNAILAVNRRAQ